MNYPISSIHLGLKEHLVTSLKIRRFEQKDTADAVKMANDFAYFDGPLTEEDLKITQAFPEGFIIAEENGEMLGLAYSYFRDVPEAVLKTWGVSKVATIELLVVDPKYGKQGVGTLLLERLIEILKQSGADLIGLTCPVQAEGAKHLYEKAGFEVSAYHMRMKVK
ncbi:GNAT family N-acetyltransferase [Candidatus Thorarchaeota archaeon]|nr:MAG: GNAT family N-acetyltransferase [Candidatus Thorarchaeota archaeon]